MANDMRRIDNLDSDTAESRGKGLLGSAPAGQTTNIDYTMPQYRIFSGLAFHVHNAQFGDTLHLSVCYPNGAEILRFYEDWVVDHETPFQGVFQYPYTARIPAGLIMRVSYNAVAAGEERKLGINYFLHRDKSVADV
jgi:hypothetical protein